MNKAQALAEMLASPGWAVLKEQAEKAKEALRREIDEAYLKPDAGVEARIKAGILRGLNIAFSEIPNAALTMNMSKNVMAQEALEQKGTPEKEDKYA